MNVLRWLYKVLTKWIWLIGILPAVLDIISTYISEDKTPTIIKRIIEDGINWNLTILAFSLGFIISSYLVYSEDLKKRDETIKALKEKLEVKPNIDIGFEHNAGLVKQKKFMLAPNPKKPNLKLKVEKKKRELLSNKGQKNIDPIVLLRSGKTPKDIKINSDYDTEIEVYLEKYKRYLIQCYESELNRALSLKPIIINEGGISATDVTIEIIMPEGTSKPKPHQDFRYEWNDHSLRPSRVEKPPEPQPYILENVDSVQVSSHILDTQRKPQKIGPDPNAPKHKEENDKWIIFYEIEKLVPQKKYAALKPFGIWAGDVKDNTTWKLPVTFYSSELKAPQKNMLSVRFIVSGE